jgi:hypothetical protein
MSASVVVLVPLYKENLDPLDEYSLDRSLGHLVSRDVRLIAPEALSLDYYLARYPHVTVERFPRPAFESIPEYNRLLLSEMFYARYSAFEYMLILQTDAILLKDDLDFWCAQPFDYIGAPWPKMFELFVNTGRFEGAAGKHVRVGVGNGGLSLRRIKKCHALLREFTTEVGVFDHTGSSEDLFFSVMGALSNDFVVPNEITASRFSMEGYPSYYYRVNGGNLPMGTHAWMKNEPEFWLRVLPDAARLVLSQTSGFA